MKIRYAVATGCPHGQFVVEAESDVERAILRAFLDPGMAPSGWKFHLHGFGYRGDVDGPCSFNFGWTSSGDTGQ